MIRGLLFHDVAVSVAHFVAFEMGGIHSFSFLRFFAHLRHGAFISVIGVHTVVDVSMEVLRSVEPWTYADKHAARKPLRPIVSGRGTGIGRSIVVPVGTLGRDSHLDSD